MSEEVPVRQRRRRRRFRRWRRWVRHTPNTRIAMNLIAAGAALAVATVVVGVMFL